MNKLKKKPTKLQLAQEQQQKYLLAKYNKKFFILIIIYQIIVIVLNGVFTRPQSYIVSTSLDNALYSTTAALLLVLIGFGLYFAYLRNNIWSGLGFTFFITALVFQSYFLINGFWTRVSIQNSSVGFKNTTINAYLSNQMYTSSSSDTYGTTAVGAIKCGLALSIAFAAIGGRAGYFEALIISLIGTVLYQLNRQLITKFAVDYGGSMGIFLFGGSMGSMLSLLLSYKQGNLIIAHHQYASKKMNRTLALIGAAFCWVFFPVLNTDISPALFFYSNAGMSTIFCISASVVTMIGLSLTFDKRIQVRNLITAPIAGGVIVGSSSANIYNPVQAILLGILAAVLQFIFNRIQIWRGTRPIYSHSVLFLFGVQGLVGGLISASFRAINKTSGNFGTLYNSLSQKFSQNPPGQLIATAISLGIGLGTALLVYPFISLVNKDTRNSMYHDKGHWLVDDYCLQNQQQYYESERQLQMEEPEQTGIKGAYSYL